MTRAEAVDLLRSWSVSQRLGHHLRAVEIVMSAFAARDGAGDEAAEAYALAGLLHDADWELAPQTHPQRIVEWCRRQGQEGVAYAISAHGATWGVPHVTPLDRALVAADDATGLVVAAAKVHPLGVTGLTAASVLKKFKQKAFAATLDRSEIEAGARLVGLTLPELFELIILSLRPYAAELEGESRV